MLITACAGHVSGICAQNTLVCDKVKISKIAVDHNGTDLVMNMNVDFSKLNLGSNRSIVLTPVIQSKDDANTKLFRSILVNGRKQHVMYERGNRKKSYPDAMEIRRYNDKEQSMHYVASVPYQSWMKGGTVRIAEDICGCGNILEQNQSKLTSYNVQAPQLFFACKKPLADMNKEREIVGRAYLDFPVGKTVIHPDYRRNPQELGKIIETINAVKEDSDYKITSIQIHGYASPESPYAHNTMLANGRAVALKNFVKKLYKFDDKLFTSVSSTPENWDGLREYVEKSNLNDKDAIVKMIKSDKDPDTKEAQIKKAYPDEYKTLLSECYPALRRSDYSVKYAVKSFSIEEAKKVYKKDPTKLSMAEMYAIANSYGMNTQEAKDVISTAVKLHPDDATANLNAGILALQKDDLTTAETYLNKAGDSAEADNARGVLLSKQEKYTEAIPYFEKAKNAGFSDAANNLDIINKYIP